MSREQPPVYQWLAEPLPRDVKQSLAVLASADDVQHLAVMPDVHLSGTVCVGVALATRELIYPEAVGSDIGCGMTAVRIDAPATLLESEVTAGQLLAGLYRLVPANRHASGTLPEALLSSELSTTRLERIKQREGRVQLGTLGRGNHFLEFQSDSDGALWLMVHSGSRAIGQAITEHHLACAERTTSGLRALVATTTAGTSYLHDQHWACEYASANRQAMIQSVARLLHERWRVSIDLTTLVDANHNHVRHEVHGEQPWFVHRKGAQAADLDEPGIIPGSMGTASFHVAGRGCVAALRSSSHGAGRKLRRGEAARSIPRREMERQLTGVWFDHRQADRLRDEAPGAYKDIHAVMRAQRELTRIVRELRPVLCYKGV